MTGKQALIEAKALCPHLHRFEKVRGLDRDGTDTFYITANQYPRGDYHIIGSGGSWELAIIDLRAKLTRPEEGR